MQSYEVDEWVACDYCERGFSHPNKCLCHDDIRKAGEGHAHRAVVHTLIKHAKQRVI